MCSRLRSEGGTSGALAAKIRELLAGQLFIPLYRELEGGPATLGQPVSVREAPFAVPLIAVTAAAQTSTTTPVSSRRVAVTPGSPALLASPSRTPNSQGRESAFSYIISLICF